MNEKSLWTKLQKMGIRGFRIENCSLKGISDCIIYQNGNSVFIELKSWTSSHKHPLSREQLNFCKLVGGLVLIRINKQSAVLCRPSEHLCSCDKQYAIDAGYEINLKHGDEISFWNAIDIMREI